jgi:parvulin-like peptidyl-prolyl isomerase
MKKLLTAVILAAFLAAFTGCSLVEVNPERDMERTVATVEGEKILKQDYVNMYYSVYQQYQQYMYIYGQSVDLESDEYQELLQTDTMNELINQKILTIKAGEYGCYDFTQEDLDDIEASYQEFMDYYRDNSRSTITADEANADLSEEEIADLVEEDLNSTLELMGFEEEDYRETLKDSKAIEKLKEIITETPDPTESEIQAEYDSSVASQQSSFTSDPASYENAISGSSTIYYNLPGTRKASHILIALPDEIQNQISQLRTDGDDEGADALRDEELAKIKESADTVYGLAEEGEDFAQLIEEYGQDPGMETRDGYVVASESTSYAPEFTEGVFSLENVGDFTEPVASDFGYHIIKYVEALPEGAVPLDEVKDEIKDNLLTAKQDELYSTQLTEWNDEMKIKIYNRRLSLDY